VTPIDNYRPETEAYTTQLAELIINGALNNELKSVFETNIEAGGAEKNFTPRSELKILDVCSGSGCISLLLHSLLSKSGKFSKLQITGLDISEDAVALANENLGRNVENAHLSISAIGEAENPRKRVPLRDSAGSYNNLTNHLRDEDSQTPTHNGHKAMKAVKAKRELAAKAKKGPAPEVQFLVHDVFEGRPPRLGDFDIIISNPPYISQEAFKSETMRSVRNWEPKLALVPSTDHHVKFARNLEVGTSWRRSDVESDVFYQQLLHMHDWMNSKVLLMEVGDEPQAIRVVKLALQKRYTAEGNRFEIWRDWPDQDPQPEEIQTLEISGHRVSVKGAGKMRAVVLFLIPQAERDAAKRDAKN
jgi:methylase of polypeptide subunit release factors